MRKIETCGDVFVVVVGTFVLLGAVVSLIFAGLVFYSSFH